MDIAYLHRGRRGGHELKHQRCTTRAQGDRLYDRVAETPQELRVLRFERLHEVNGDCLQFQDCFGGDRLELRAALLLRQREVREG